MRHKENRKSDQYVLSCDYRGFIIGTVDKKTAEDTEPEPDQSDRIDDAD